MLTREQKRELKRQSHPNIIFFLWKGGVGGWEADGEGDSSSKVLLPPTMSGWTPDLLQPRSPRIVAAKSHQIWPNHFSSHGPSPQILTITHGEIQCGLGPHGHVATDYVAHAAAKEER